MATLSDSPTLFNGQSWSQWLENIPKDLLDEPDSQETSSPECPKKDSMKLRKEDIELYGICPARDEFYLVVCEHCNHVIKPQALQRHLDQRHSISPSYSSSNSDSSTTCTSSTSQSPVKDQKVSSAGSTSSSNVHGKDHKHASNAHKPTRKPNNNSGPPQVHPKDKPPQVSKCKKNPMVKMERIQSSNMNKTPPASSKCSDHLSSDKAKKLGNERRSLGSEYSGMNSSTGAQESHTTPTTRTLTMLSSATVATTATPVISTTKAAVSSPKLNSTASTSSSKVSPSSHYSSVAATSSSGLTKKVQLTTVTVTTGTLTVSKSSKPTLTSQSSNSSSKKASTRKTPLCKDREYDANKHCGVWMEDMKRQCTRSLTCKTHSLSLRRAVKGRSKSFDELLREHREAKEQLLLKTKGEASLHGASHNNAAANIKSTASTSLSTPSSTSKSTPTTPTTPVMFKSPVSETKVATSVVTSPVIVKPQVPVKEKLCLNSSITRQASLPVFSRNECVPVPESVSYLSSDGEEEEEKDKIDYPCSSHHPRPAAVNSFGSWIHAGGCYVFSRKEDLCRAAFFAAVEKHLHPPPHKKLCVESNLPKGSTISTSTRDPYDFAFGDSVQGAGGKVLSKGLAKLKPVTGNSSPNGSIKSGLSEIMSPGRNSDSSDSNSLHSPSGVKRKRSSSVVQGPGCLNNGTSSSVLNSPSTSFTVPVLCSSPIAITIPGSINFNLSSSTLSNINASLSTNKAQIIHGKNTLVKDIGKVCVDGNSQLNGQLISLSGSNLADVTHIQLNNLSEKCALAKSNKNASKGQQSLQNPLVGKVQLNKSPVTLHTNSKPSSVFSRRATLPNSLNLAPLLSSVSVGGFLQLDAQLCNSVGSSALTLTTSSAGGDSNNSVSAGGVSAGGVSAGGGSGTANARSSCTNNNSDGLLLADTGSVQLSSPILLSGSTSPTSPLNGLLSITNTASKTTNSSNHGNHLCDTDSLVTKADLTLAEELLTHHGSAFSLSPAKSDGVLSRSISAGTEISAAVTQVSLSAAAATAQQLAAAALNLTTQSGCLLSGSNNIPQLYAATHHVLAKSSSTAPLSSIQLQTKPGLKTISGSPGKIPLQPLSLTILSPGSSGASSQNHHSHLVLHTADDSHPAANLS